jgi:hypothetical protein
MSNEAFALSGIEPASIGGSEHDYEAIRARVMDSARGRWFLQEYTRRNRNSDKELVLAALERLERLVRTQRDGGPPGARPDNSELSEHRSHSLAEISGLSERLLGVVNRMRERGFDAAACDEIESLASHIRERASSQSQAPIPHAAPDDPLAALRAMSEEERIAVFT